jgi:hypothetical protein
VPRPREEEENFMAVLPNALMHAKKYRAGIDPGVCSSCMTMKIQPEIPARGSFGPGWHKCECDGIDIADENGAALLRVRPPNEVACS